MYLSSFFSLSLSLSFSLFFVVGQVMISHHSSYLRESRFSRSFLKFHFSISSHFYSTFTRSRFLVISISLSFLEKSEREKNFTIFFLEKRVKFDTKFHKKNYHSRRVRTQKKVCQEWFFNSRKFSIILEKFHFSILILKLPTSNFQLPIEISILNRWDECINCNVCGPEIPTGI